MILLQELLILDWLDYSQKTRLISVQPSPGHCKVSKLILLTLDLYQVLFFVCFLKFLTCGNRGYMAPEYVVRGKLTEKADVYSFGVLMIEVITGKRNNAFVQEAGSILQTVSN